MSAEREKRPACRVASGAWCMAMKRLVVYGALVAFVLSMSALPLMGMRNERGVVAGHNEPDTWQAGGTGDDTTVVLDVERTRVYDVGWVADCPVEMTLNQWDGRRIGRTLRIGSGMREHVRLPLTRGGYFFDGVARCEWTVRVSPT